VLGLSTAGVQRVVVTADGNVGVGATTTSAKLTIKNPSAAGEQQIVNIQSAASTDAIAKVTFNQTTDVLNIANFTNTGALVFGTGGSGTERMRIDASGDLILLNGLTIGSSSDPGGKILIAGAALPAGAGTHFLKWNNVTGSVTYDTSSARYKDNIRDSIYGLDSVLQMRSVQFEYKDTGRSDVGLIAEELNPIVPELVGKDGQGKPESVAYDRMVSVLIKAVQELEARLAALESK
jgi:hypothetical protein